MSRRKSKNLESDTRNSGIYKFEPTENQKGIINEMIQNRILVITGEGGTTKDTMCLFRATRSIIDKDFDMITIFKPIEEVGKSIGYLKGSLEEKVEPYEDFYKDLLKDLLNKTYLERVLSKTEFKIANFVRGNTIKNSFIIVSEAQNYDLHSLITIITRVHESSRIVFNGDMMQSDIGKKSGLKDFITILERAGVGKYIQLGDEFQMRSPDITKINREYSKFLQQKFG